MNNSLAGRYHLAQIQERIGDLVAALAGYTWFVQGDDAPFNRFIRDQEKSFENAEDVVYIGRAADRWATMTAAYKDKQELHDAIFNTFYNLEGMWSDAPRESVS